MATVSTMDMPKRQGSDREKKKGKSHRHMFPSPTVTVTGSATASRTDLVASSATEKRYVVFRRDEQGYGLKVFGDNPVFVESVKEGGPADSVGLRPGDRIIRVNNQLVTDKNHYEVVELIKSAPCVAMTVIRTVQSLIPDPYPSTNNAGAMYENGPDVLECRPGNPPRKVSLPALSLMDKFSTEEDRIEERNETKARSDSLPSSRSFPEALENVLYQHGEDNRVDGRSTMREMPPTPPPIERIPRFHDTSDLTTRSMRAANAAGLNRRRSNPEAMHFGVARMTLTSNNQVPMPLVEQPSSSSSSSSLNRSSSAVNVQRKNSIPDSQPPALPVKKRLEHSARYRNASLHDVTEVGSPSSGTPPPPYPEAATFPPSSNNVVSISSSLTTLPGTTVGLVRMPNVCGDSSLQPSSSVLQHLDSYGPFSNFHSLVNKHLPHLAVFINFLFLNNSPDITPVLFHILTDYYTKGNFKEMQRWAVELHSTFVVPDSPLDLFSCVACEHSHSLIHAIDEVLAKPDREEVLRDVFTKVRSVALEAAQLRLKEFKHKLTLNLGGMYGPSEAELAKGANSVDVSKEMAEALLGPHLEALTVAGGAEEPENRCDRQAALACALATFLKFNGIKASRSDNTYLVDKWPLLLQKDKSKFKLKDKKKNIAVSGHQFGAVAVSTTLLHCTHCGDVMWGVAPQGYQCLACEYTAHRLCVRNVEEPCVGDKKELRRSFISMDSFALFSRKRSNNSPTAISNARKSHDEKEEGDHLGSTEQLDVARGSYVNKVVHQFESGKVHGDAGMMGPPPDPTSSTTASSIPSKAPSLTVVGRSESLKSTHNRKSHLARGAGVRKKSDPAHLHRSTETNDNGETSSSGDLGIGMSSSSLSQSASHSGSLHFTMDIADDDSDFEADPEHIPPWQVSLEPALVDSLSTQQKKRQEVLAEFFHTEQTHVRNLKVLCKVFYQPMVREKLLPDDLMTQIFANLEEMTMLHCELNQEMKRVKKSPGLIGKVGDVILRRFTGQHGSNFRTAAAAFCHNQSSGLEALKISQHKNARLVQFLHEASANPLCRRLELKDIIPTGMQRLTKYPLLLESLLKYTPNGTTGEEEEEEAEYKKIQEALAACRTTLDYVNQAVLESNNKHRLRELQDRIDMTSFVKSQKNAALDHKSLDLSQYRLLHDGDLTWRLTKQKTVDLHVILLNKILLLVTKQEDKLLLKFHTPPVAGINENKRSDSFTTRSWAPVLSLDGLAVRDVATDAKAFFLFLSTDNGAQMYELVANSISEQKQWKRYILSAVQRNTKCYESIPEIFPVTATVSTVGSVLSLPLHTVPSLDLPSSVDQSATLDTDDHHVSNEVQPSSARLEPTSWTAMDSDSDVDDDEEEEEEQVQLLTPADIVVTEATRVMDDAHLIFSPLQELKRRDDLLEEALEQKSRLVSQILGLRADSPCSNLDDDEGEGGESVRSGKSVKSVMHHLMQHITQLTRLVKDSLSVSQGQEDFIVQRQRLDSFTVSTSSTSASDQVDQPTTETSTTSTVDCAVQTNHQRPLIAATDLQPVVGHLHRQLSILLRMVAEQEHEKDRLSWQLTVTKDELDSLRAQTRCSNDVALSRPHSTTSTLQHEEEEKALHNADIAGSADTSAPVQSPPLVPDWPLEVQEGPPDSPTDDSPLQQVQHL